jgi:PAS domain S-box-containing protein
MMSRDAFFSVWDRMLDPVMVVDAELRVLHVNLELERLLKIGREVVGQPIDALVPLPSRARHRAMASAFIESGENRRRLSHPRVIKARRGDGVDLPVEVSISTADVEGQHYYVLVLRDLSEQLTLQDEAAALTRRLARIERMEALTTLSAGLGRQMGKLLDETWARALHAREGQQHFEPLFRSLESARQQVRDLLRFGQGTSDGATTELDTRALLRRVEGEAQRLAPGRVTARLDGPLPRVRVVEAELERALGHLVNNGLDAMEPGAGHLTLKARVVQLEAPLACTTLTLTPGRWLAISVEDEGRGLSEAALSHLFEPFYTTKPGAEVRGLGLAMVYGFMRSAGGAVDVETQPGRGSRFTLFFPVAADGTDVTDLTDLTHSIHVTDEPHARPAEVARKVRRVLLIDTDAFVARALKRTLELLGHACHVLSHAEDALSLVRLDPGAFDLVVCELNLPSMRGDELAHRLSILRPGLAVCVIATPERLPRADGFRVLPRPVTATDIDLLLKAR